MAFLVPVAMLLGGSVPATSASRPAPELFPTSRDTTVLQRQADDPRLVRLKAAVFDPLRHAPPDFSEVLPSGPVLRPATDARPLLIQFWRSISAVEHAALDARGFEVIGYVPNRTLVVRPRHGASTDALLAVPGRRWVGAFQSGYKLDPELAGRLAASETGDQRLEIDAVLFPGDDPWPLTDLVRQRFDEVGIANVARGRTSSIVLTVPASSLRRLVGSLIEDETVQFVALRPPLVPSNDNAVWIGQSYDRINGPGEAEEADPKPYFQSATVWAQGLTGEGQIIAVADTGLEHTMCFFEDPEHAVTPQTVTPPAPLVVDNDHRKIVALNAPIASSLDSDDTFRHGTHVAGSAVGDSVAHAANGADPGHDHGDGMAPGARLVFEDISGPLNSSCGTGIVVNSVGALLEQEYDAGARISTNSWGPGSSAAARDVDGAVWDHEDYLVLWAAGNHGAGGVDALATCKNCVTVGATENWDLDFTDAFGNLDPENMTALSSRGPTADGRIKPDVVAPGFRVDSSRFPVDYVVDENDPACDESDPGVCLPGFGGCYIVDLAATCHATGLLGTSMASPLTAGLAALARQYFSDGFHPAGQAVPADAFTPSAALLKAVLINGARNMTGRLYERRSGPTDLGPLADAPSQVQGWGRVMLDDALYFSGETRRSFLLDIPNAEGVATGESVTAEIAVTGAGEPLKLTLAWTGPPALPATGALVNDLDLLITAPGGTIYRGNQWTTDDVNVPGDKHSTPNPFGKDSLNNVEGILIPSPEIGIHTVTVFGSSVPGAPGVMTQGAALVVTGEIAPVGPPPTGDGIEGAPMLVEKLDDAGTSARVSWDVTCAAPGYHLLHGPLGTASGPTPGGAECGLGASGSFDWPALPGGDTWLLVVPDDDLFTEGSWGRRSDDSERAGTTPSALCGMTEHLNTGACF